MTNHGFVFNPIIRHYSFSYDSGTIKCSEQEINEEKTRATPEHRMDLFCFPLAEFHNHIEDEAESNPDGNVVSKSHQERREEGRYGF